MSAFPNKNQVVSSTEGNVLTIMTIQIAPFRTLMTALKDILMETNITFEPDGMRIINMDKSHTVLVHLFLDALKFEFYECKKDKIIIGVNMYHLFKLINTIENEETLTIYIENSDYVDGIISYLTLKYDNGDIKQCYSQKLRLIEPDMEELVVPDVEYSTVINLPTTDFQKIIRDLNGISDRIEIKSVGNDLIFSCEGNFASSRIFRSESDGNMEFIQKSDASVIIQGEFSLKSLSHFIKCTPLCSHLEMYLGNDLPLIVKYDVASLGEIKLCLAPLPPA